MPDLPGQIKQMILIETLNVNDVAVTLEPGQSHLMAASIAAAAGA